MPSTPNDNNDLEDAGEWADAEIASLDGFIEQRPLAALAIAAAFGFIVARLIF